MVVTVKITGFWVVILCSLVGRCQTAWCHILEMESSMSIICSFSMIVIMSSDLLPLNTDIFFGN
jgi:hypothetical protein